MSADLFLAKYVAQSFQNFLLSYYLPERNRILATNADNYVEPTVTVFRMMGTNQNQEIGWRQEGTNHIGHKRSEDGFKASAFDELAADENFRTSVGETVSTTCCISV